MVSHTCNALHHSQGKSESDSVQSDCAGSLLVVLLLRTAHYNLSKLKDVYLHTNTLAALANLAPHISALSSHAAQRLVSLFDMLSRRCSRLPSLHFLCMPHILLTSHAEGPLTAESSIFRRFLAALLE